MFSLHLHLTDHRSLITDCPTPSRRVTFSRMPRAKPNPPVLNVEQLSVRRGRTTILDRVDWRIERGEHWVILGANGSGKTSLLSALTGYLMPTEGDLTLLGETYGDADWRELRTRVGIVSSAVRQMMSDRELPLETVVAGKYAMIDYWGKLEPADEKRARSILRQIECGHLADRPWAVLSQGERQRVLIGRALMARPRLLILDEPCAGLDPVARENFLHFIDRLAGQRNSPTLILVTHHVEEITPAFTHALLLRDGRVLEAGAVADTLRNDLLSDAFGTAVRLTRRGGRYALAVAGNNRVVT